MTQNGSAKIGVGAVVFRDEKVLIIKRAKAPFKGEWSIPGGRLEFGERLADAVIREVREETGVEIEILGLLDVFEGLPSGGEFEDHIVMIDYVAEWLSGEPVASDDAEEAEFVDMEAAVERLSWDTTRKALARAVEIRTGFKIRP